jgi:hypothetical protein
VSLASVAIPTPPVVHAGVSALAMLLIWGIPVVVVVLYAVRMSISELDVLPVAACVGALVCALNEPIYDILGKLVYARTSTSYVAYSNFGRSIPWWLVIGYIPWVGVMPCLLARMMAAGVTRQRLHAIALGLTASVGLVELLNAVWLHGWNYYGGYSARGMLSGGVIQMSAMPLLCGFMFFAFADGRSQVWRAALGVLVPAVTLPITFASTSWPLYISNYAHVAQWLHWVGAGVSVLFCVLAVSAVSILAVGWRGRDREGTLTEPQGDSRSSEAGSILRTGDSGALHKPLTRST